MRTSPNMPVMPGEIAGPVGDGTVQGFQPGGYFALPKDDICRALICCGDDDPIGNWTSDTAPTRTFISVSFPGGNDIIQPQLGDSWTSWDCVGVYISEISQADADQQALAAMQDCIGDDWLDPTGEPIVPTYNEPTTCSIPCASGGSFYHSIASGLFVGRTQVEANSRADIVCAAEAATLKFCIVGSLDGGCVGSIYLDVLLVSPYSSGMTVGVVGSLPTGLSIFPIVGGGTFTIGGTCTAHGIWTFLIVVTDSSGNYTARPFSITVLEITTGSLPNCQNGVAYSTQLAVTGGSGNYSWSITSGVLPAGLSMTSSGLISGTPTESGTFPLEFTVVDLG